MTPSLKLEGAKELEEGLMELQGVTAMGVVRRSLLKAVDPVIQSAKGRAPVDRGDLAKSIDAATRLSKRQRSLNRPIVSAHGVEVYVGPGLKNGGRGVRHAHLVEFGTSHMAPQPFMRPAWLSNLDAVFNGLAQLMGLELAKAAKRAAAKALKVKR